MLAPIDDKKLIFVTGKGGVGKSTGAAAVAKSLAQRNRRVLVVEPDTYSAMNDLLGVPKGAEGIITLGNGIDAINLRADESLVQTLTRFLPSERVVRAITQNRVTASFFDSAPSVNEFVLLDQMLALAEERGETYDHVIVDLPASGHAVTFLAVPKTLHGMMRGVGPVAKRAEAIAKRISNDRETAVVAVCLPEEMPVNETIELAENLQKELGRSLTMCLVNMVHRAPVDGAHRTALSELHDRLNGARDPSAVLFDEPTPTERLVAGNSLAMRWFDRDARYLGILHERLDTPLVEIPMFYEVDHAKIVRRVADYLISGDPNDPADALAS
jgi:anion-transporting  ArsA/GET3 family ATPase